jgi:crotonobetainyl-CoA:carnitine CoA-transferase CaiB-like acyl-CoA transferase
MTTPDKPSHDYNRPEKLLADYTVVDFTSMMAGPYCTRWLADLGADVIKVEPLDGDHMRTRPPFRGESSMVFGHLNSGKSSIAVDLKHPEGNELARRLCDRADLVVESFRPGVMSRLKLDALTLRERKPELIYCSISGFGQTGPMALHPAYAPVIHAASGFDMATFEYQDGIDRPPNSAIPIADMLTALYACSAIQGALLKRERGHGGTTIDVNLMESMLSLMIFEFQSAQQPIEQRRPLYRPLRTADGFVLVAPVNENNFQNLCSVTTKTHWLSDPRLISAAARFQNWDYYMDLIEEWTSQRTGQECEAALMGAGVPASRYRRIADAIGDDHLVKSGAFASIADEAGDYLTTNLPFSLSGIRPVAGTRVAQLGEDTDSILRRMLRLSTVEIARLSAVSAIALNGNHSHD